MARTVKFILGVYFPLPFRNRLKITGKKEVRPFWCKVLFFSNFWMDWRVDWRFCNKWKTLISLLFIFTCAHLERGLLFRFLLEKKKQNTHSNLRKERNIRFLFWNKQIIFSTEKQKRDILLVLGTSILFLISLVAIHLVKSSCGEVFLYSFHFSLLPTRR